MQTWFLVSARPVFRAHFLVLMSSAPMTTEPLSLFGSRPVGQPLAAVSMLLAGQLSISAAWSGLDRPWGPYKSSFPRDSRHT